MDDENEGDGICVCQSIENQDGLHGKMPRTSAIGGGHNHRDASHDEADDGGCEAKALREVEAPEGDPVVQEVATPYGYCVEGKQPFVLYVSQREHTFLHVVHHLLELGHEREPLHGIPKEGNGDD